MSKMKLVLEDYGDEQQVIHAADNTTIIIVERQGAREMACLIVAAPDLLEALKGAALLIQNQLSPEGRQNVMRKMDAAIAKAEGR